MNKTKTFKTFVFILLVLTLISSVSARSFIIHNASDETQNYFTINGTTGYIGIGVNTPTSLLQIANNNWISAKNYAGTGTINMFKVNSANQIEVGAPLNIGSFEFTADSGLVTFVDMPVTSASSIGTSQSYVFKVDGENILTVYSESDGAGGIQNKRVGIGTITPTHALHVVGDANITGSIYSNGVLLTPDTNTFWNITGSNYLINSTNILELNETKLNTTIDARVISGVPDVWVNESGDTMSGNLSMGGNYIQNLANGTLSQDAVTKSQLDAINASFSGDLSGYVPYTGATNNLDLNNKNITNVSYIGIGTTTPSEKLEVVGKIKLIHNTLESINVTFEDTTSSALRITNENGYLAISPRNTGWGHIETDRTLFYFNKGVRVDTGKIGSYNEDLELTRGAVTKLTLGESEATFVSGLNLSVDTDAFFVDATNNKIGIGTTTPTHTLHVVGNSNITGNVSIGGTLNIQSNKITNLANGTDSQDAVTKSQLDAVEGSIINTHVAGDNIYLYNDSTTMYFNESKLNATIEIIGDTNYVPYTSATGNVDLGTYNLTAEEVHIKQGSNEYKFSWEGGYPGIYADYGDMFFGIASDQTTYFNYYVGEQIYIGESNNKQRVYVNGNITAIGGDICIDGGNCLSTVSSADGYIGDAQTHTAGGDLNMNQNDLTTVNQITFNNSRVNIGSSTTTASGTNSIAIGNSAVASENAAIAIGGGDSSGALASTTGAIAIGYDSEASTGSYTTAIGSGATATGGNSLALAFNAKATESYAFALGGASSATGTYSIAIGGNSISSGANAIAIGSVEYNPFSPSYTEATASGSIAIGKQAKATASNAVCIGTGCVNNVANEMKIGGSVTHSFLDTTLQVGGNTNISGTLNLLTNKITNLANGTLSQDAVTLSQLQSVNSSILSGDVVGPSSATDNAIARFNGVTGKLIQNSGVYIDDSNKVGIGTATPLNTLDVAGGVVIGSALAGATTAPANSLMVEEEIYSKNIPVKHKQYWSTEFFTAHGYGLMPWIISSLNGGVISSNGYAIDNERMGNVVLRSHSANVYSGYGFNIGAAGLLFGGGEKTSFLFSPTVTTGGKLRLGFFDTMTSAEVVEGAWIEIVDNVLYGRIANTVSAGEEQTLTNYTVTAGTAGSAGTWYNAYITLNDDATAVTFELWDSPKTTLLWNETITSTTNIPKTTWRYFGHGVLGYIEAPTEVTEIVKIAFMDLEINRVLDR